MKRTDFLGATFLISGVMLYGIIHFAIANHIPSMNGWSDPPGKMQQARDEIMVNVPYFLSIILIIVGFIFLFFKETKRLTKRLLHNLYKD